MRDADAQHLARARRQSAAWKSAHEALMAYASELLNEQSEEHIETARAHWHRLRQKALEAT